MNYLEFEEPIRQLREQLTQARDLQEQSDVDMESLAQDLESKIREVTEQVYSNLTPWQRVQVSRHPDRPYTLNYIEALTEGHFMELHGDRTVKDDKAMVGGFGFIDDQSVMFIGQQKGVNTKMRQYRNFGMANPEGYRKALRLMKLAEKFNRPIVTLIDTPGAFPGLEAEERGQGEAIARNLIEMCQLRVPVICIVIGEGASGGALGIGIGDRTIPQRRKTHRTPPKATQGTQKKLDFEGRNRPQPARRRLETATGLLDWRQRRQRKREEFPGQPDVVARPSQSPARRHPHPAATQAHHGDAAHRQVHCH